MTQVFDGPDHLSVSQMHALGECPWHWFLERVVRVPQVPGWALVGGKAYHALTEYIDIRALDTEEWVTDPDEVKALWGEYLDEEISNQLDHSDVPKEEWKASGRASNRWPNKEDESYWREMGTTWAMNYITWRLNNPAWEIATFGGAPAIEMEIGGVFGAATLPLVGYIDRVFHDPVTGEYIVVDLKSGSRGPADTLQLGTYSLFVEQLYGIRPRWGTFWMARTGSTGPMVDLHADWPPERLEHEIKVAEAVIRGDRLSCDRGGYCPTSSTAQYCYACTGIKEDTILPWEVSVRLPALYSSPQVLTYGGQQDSTESGE